LDRPPLGLLQRGDVGGDSTDRIRHPNRVEQGELQRHVGMAPVAPGDNLLALHGLAFLEDASVVGLDSLGNSLRKQVVVGQAGHLSLGNADDLPEFSVH